MNAQFSGTLDGAQPSGAVTLGEYAEARCPPTGTRTPTLAATEGNTYATPNHRSHIRSDVTRWDGAKLGITGQELSRIALDMVSYAAVVPYQIAGR
jgi:hypothetical protein